MKIHIITNFTGAFTSYFDSSIMRIAREKGLFEPIFYNLGDYSLQAQHRVDDKPYGGGAGALIEIEPMYRAITSIDPENTMKKIYLGPRGERLKQAKIEQLSKEFQDQDIIILCGHYEGVDHRVFEMFIFEQYSIGDFVVSSGELAAMVFIDAVVRLIPGVVGNNKSLHEESFSEALEGKPEYPQYTRPADFMGYKVPEVLLSGDPKKINEWRKKN
ncbi:tRNA (guanosine(37)-N1)-methyltransferase TrmD [Candidatus Gracilibacteria bacterium]|nr:tRNA (guanosine(37)-N1)-methyltransferase TrmD [Candidatus Gracilibacteria bacterium]